LISAWAPIQTYRWGRLQQSPDPLARFKGAYFQQEGKRKRGNKRKGKVKRGKKGKGKEKE